MMEYGIFLLSSCLKGDGEGGRSWTTSGCFGPSYMAAISPNISLTSCLSALRCAALHRLPLVSR